MKPLPDFNKLYTLLYNFERMPPVNEDTPSQAPQDFVPMKRRRLNEPEEESEPGPLLSTEVISQLIINSHNPTNLITACHMTYSLFADKLIFSDWFANQSDHAMCELFLLHRLVVHTSTHPMRFTLHSTPKDVWNEELHDLLQAILVKPNHPVMWSMLRLLCVTNETFLFLYFVNLAFTKDLNMDSQVMNSICILHYTVTNEERLVWYNNMRMGMVLPRVVVGLVINYDGDNMLAVWMALLVASNMDDMKTRIRILKNLFSTKENFNINTAAINAFVIRDNHPPNNTIFFAETSTVRTRPPLPISFANKEIQKTVDMLLKTE